MLDQTEFERWRAAARGAERSAELQVAASIYNWACFAAEQSAQLAVKGLLHGIGAGVWGHDLVELGRAAQVSMGEPIPEVVTAALQRLSRHYIPARYPDAHPAGAPEAHYGRQDGEQALADLRTITDWVDGVWARLSALPGE